MLRIGLKTKERSLEAPPFTIVLATGVGVQRIVTGDGFARTKMLSMVAQGMRHTL